MKVVHSMEETPRRDALPTTAFEWCLENVSPFLNLFNETRQKDDAKAEYHPMVDGIVWSDQLPCSSSVDSHALQRVFCVLVHVRTSKILGESIPPVGQTLLNTICQECPQWSFNVPCRKSVSRKPDFEKIRAEFFRKLEQILVPKPGVQMPSTHIIQQWFQVEWGGSLVLPDGWYGRPYDNQHEATSVVESGNSLTLILDEKLILRFEGLRSVVVKNRELVFGPFDSLWFQWSAYGSCEDGGTMEYQAGEVKIIPAPG